MKNGGKGDFYTMKDMKEVKGRMENGRERFVIVIVIFLTAKNTKTAKIIHEKGKRGQGEKGESFCHELH